MDLVGLSSLLSPFPVYSCSLCRRLNLNFLEGMYGNFAGRDASRGMAKQSFDVGALCRFFFFLFSADLKTTRVQTCLHLSTNHLIDQRISSLMRCTFFNIPSYFHFLTLAFASGSENMKGFMHLNHESFVLLIHSTSQDGSNISRASISSVESLSKTMPSRVSDVRCVCMYYTDNSWV